MHLHDDVPEVFGGVRERLVAQDPRVVDEDVDALERVERALQDVLAALDRGDVVVVGRRLAARRADLLDHVVGHPVALPRAVARAAEIVHEHRCALARERERVLASDAAARSRHDRHLAVEQAHDRRPPVGGKRAFAHHVNRIVRTRPNGLKPRPS